MGRMSAEGYKDCVDDGLIPFEVALRIHLTSNHYPSIPLYMVPVAMSAIEKANMGEWEEKISLPKDVEHRVYGKSVPVHEVVSYMHLDTFLEPDEEF